LSLRGVASQVSRLAITHFPDGLQRDALRWQGDTIAMTSTRKRWLLAIVVAALAVSGYYAWTALRTADLPDGVASGNGRIEAVEIDVATLTAGRLKDVLVDEGDIVEAGAILAHMDIDQLEAQLRQSQAQLKRAVIGIDTANSTVRQRQAEKTAAEAVVSQRAVQLDAANRRLVRSAQLAKSNTVSQQVLDDDRAASESAKAAVWAAQAQLAATEAGISTARAQVIDAETAVEAARAVIANIAAQIDDSTLKAPRAGRVQYRVAQPGEVLAGGGRVLNLVDLGDVYMTFFLPTDLAGRIAIGTEVRLVLDAAPLYVIPAKVSYVADVAQFTPKTVETADERQKLTFRIKAKIAPALLKKYIQYVKTGLPGVAYVKLDAAGDWPVNLSRVVQ